MVSPFARTLLVIIGAIWSYIGYLQRSLFWIALGLGLSLLGCYIWTKLKRRHWTYMFWGTLTPIGLLGISLLKDKNEKV